MKTDRFNKTILICLLICLAVIAFKPTEKKYVQLPPSNVDIDNRSRIVQIAPNLIGVIDTGSNTGLEQLVVFEYDDNNKEFKLVTTLNYQEYLTHPQKYGIPIREKRTELDQEDVNKIKE